ncbi:MAG: glycerol-3-phosphate acyltransferase [Chloroflexota bacterium]
MTISLTTIVLWTVGTYLIASIPFSLLVGRIFLGKDIRDYGDGNPGATNVKRAGASIWVYLIALFLDGFKGIFPVGIPYAYMGWTTLDVMPVAFAAILGHAFSIFLGFRGGKAVATSAGIWIGLIVWEAVVVIPVMLVAWYLIIEEDDWVIMATMVSLLVYLLITRASDTAMLGIWFGNFLLLIYKHRGGELGKMPTLKFMSDKAESTG